MKQTRSQEMAEKIYCQVTKAKRGGFGDDYGRVCQRFPTLVLTNGLMQTLAFFRSKATSEKPNNTTRAFDTFLRHLKNTLGIDEVPSSIDEYTRKCSFLEYRLLTQRSLEAAQWYKRYAESVLDVQPGDEND